MVDNIKERLGVLFPGITFDPDGSDGGCSIGGGAILEWGRLEPQPTIPELEAVPDAEVGAWLFTQRVESMTDAVQTHLDTIAQSWGYDNIVSLCTYDGNSDPKYSAEGSAGKTWRSSVWRHCEDEWAKIVAGTRAEPESNEAFVAELPTIARPIV